MSLISKLLEQQLKIAARHSARVVKEALRITKEVGEVFFEELTKDIKEEIGRGMTGSSSSSPSSKSTSKKKKEEEEEEEEE